MKPGWDKQKLGNVCTIVKDKHNSKSLPYIGLEDIESGSGKFVGNREPHNVKSSTFHFTTEHLLYGRLRPYLNKVLLPDFEGHCSSEIFPIKPKPTIYKEFLYYWITKTDTVEAINKTCTGARMPRANMKEVLDFELAIPPLPVQKRIVATLDKAFEGIETAKANAQKNLENVRELFESYLQSVFTNKGEDWEEKKLGGVYDVRDGTHDSPKYQPQGYALITSKNLKRDGLNYNKVKYISEKDYNKINERSAVHKGDILFAMIGTIGNPIVVEVEPDFAIKNVALFKVPTDQNSYFLKYYLDSEQTLSKMMREAKGTTQKFVGLGYLRNFPIRIPPLPEQERIVAKLDALVAETNRLEAIYQQKLDDLEELKKSILQKAFNGELH